MGEWEYGRMGEWENGRKGEDETTKSPLGVTRWGLKRNASTE